MPIATVGEYEAALRRIIELEDFPEGSPEAVELAELIKGVADWNKGLEGACPQVLPDLS
jgi:hypothetical protein